MRAALIASSLVVTHAAAAQPAETQPARTERYGTTIAIADGISVATAATGIALLSTSDSTGVRVVGVFATVIGAGGYIWASPIVHHLRGRSELSKVDIGMRVVIPGLAAGIAAGVSQCKDTEPTCRDPKATILVAGAAGVLVTSTIDIVFMAKQRVPYVAPAAGGGAVAGIAGTF